MDATPPLPDDVRKFVEYVSNCYGCGECAIGARNLLAKYPAPKPPLERVRAALSKPVKLKADGGNWHDVDTLQDAIRSALAALDEHFENEGKGEA